MTQTSAFHFESLVWDWPIAIYLFLIGISAGLVTLAVLLRRFYPQAGGADSTLLRTTLIVGPGAVILGLLILVFHLTRPWTFWKLMFHYSFTSVMSMGVMLFQLYMVVLVLWLAKIFEHDLLALQQRWLPKLGIVQKVLSLLTPVHRGLETLMLVLAVLLNLLVRAIPAKYTEFDLSEAKMYTLSDSTKALVEGLEKDVYIYYLCETGSEDTIITKLLDHYAAESGHLSWEQKDPTLYPTFAAKYGAENVSTGSLIVTCGENSTVLDAADLYEYDYTDYYTTGSASVTFGGEKQITSAIYKLTAAEQSHAYYTTNHGEQSLTDSLTDALDAQNIDAQPLDLLTSTIPEDCDLLIINAPTSDFTAGDGLVDEISQLQDYLAAGGKLLLTSSVYAQTPQLDAVLAQFGLARVEGMVVEGDSSKALYNSAWSLLPDYGTPTESTALNGVNTSTHVMLSVAQGITVTETEDVTAEPLLNSSSAAYAKTDINDLTTMEREDGNADGPFALAVWARNEDTGAEVLWIGCPNMDNEQLYQSMPGNLTFLQGCAASLVGQDVLVDTKALEAEPITVAGSTAAALGLTFVFVLPAAVLIAGAVVVLLRRRR